jgi:hypothetical protein
MQIYKYVSHDGIIPHLVRGWMVVIPTCPHPVADERGVMMIWLCECLQGMD